MKLKLYFEDNKSSMGGWEIVSLFKLMWWIFLERIKPKQKSSIYFIRKLKPLMVKEFNYLIYIYKCLT